MKVRSVYFSLTLVAVIIVGVVLGCSGTQNACVATVEYGGTTFEGKGSSAGESKSNACNNYCRDADPQFDSRYRVWVTSPKGIAAGSPSKKESIFKDPELMKFVTETCSRVCVADMKPTSTCK